MSEQASTPDRLQRRPPSGAAVHRPAVTIALNRALLQEWARSGFSALRLEEVARKAGVGKAALYRRWPSKLAMVSDALSALPALPPTLPDRGSLRADLDHALRELRKIFRHPLYGRILLDLHAESRRSPVLGDLVRARVQAPRRALLAELVARAVTRRELPVDTDAAFAADMIVSMLYWRVLITGGRADDDFLDQLAAAVRVALGDRLENSGDERPSRRST